MHCDVLALEAAAAPQSHTTAMLEGCREAGKALNPSIMGTYSTLCPQTMPLACHHTTRPWKNFLPQNQSKKVRVPLV